MISARIPVDCPRCGKALYPISATRPQPGLSLLGKLGFLIAGVAATAVYVLIVAVLKAATEGLIPIKLAAPIALLPALALGILIGLVVNRLPLVVKVRCARCHWGEMLKVPRAARARLSARRPMPTMVQVGTARGMPTPSVEQAPAALNDSSPFDQIVNDGGKHAEIRAWIYAEFVSGRSFDEILEELISGGWNKEDAETLVEEGRKATRDRRP